MRVLVVGANGQLGYRACEELARRGHEVRGSVRTLDRAAGLAEAGVEAVVADPGSDTGLGEALQGVDAVLLTANTAAPRAGDDASATQRALERVVRDADGAGVRRFCLVSIPKVSRRHVLPMEQEKERLERLMRDSAMETVVLRFPPFMEVWLALVGSSLPVQGDPRATVDRPSPFLRRFRALTGRLVEDRGLMLVSGSRNNRNAFIAVRDVARACAEALERPDLGGADVDVGGPEVLTWGEIAELFGEALGRRVHVVTTPGAVFGALAAVLKPVAAVPSATMALNQLIAEMESPWTPGGGGLVQPETMTTVRQFLEEKSLLGASR